MASKGVGGQKIAKKRGRPRKTPPKADVIKGAEQRDYNTDGSDAITEDEKKRLARYKPVYCSKVVDYFSVDEEGKWTGTGVPCMEKFAAQLGGGAVSMKTINLWREHYPEFNEACELAEDAIKAILMDMGVSKNYNSDFIKFTLGAVHNFSPVERRKVADDKGAGSFSVNVHVEE